MPLPLPPILVYDAACAFCRRWVARWRSRIGSRVWFLPRQVPLLPELAGVSRKAARKAVQLREPNGRVYSGADAVFRALGRAPGFRAIALSARVPVLRAVAGLTYYLVAGHRRLAARVDSWLFGRSTAPPGSRIVRWAFLRALGLTYLAAFVSLRRQVLGLYGARGISPIRDVLDEARSLPPNERWREVPTLFWFGTSDRILVASCTLGVFVSLLLVVGVAPLPALAVLWALYLSFMSAGSEFLAYQWDALLLEASLHALLIAPAGLLPKLGSREPPWTAVWLMRALVFRLHYQSGVAKVRSGDRTWKLRTACNYHFETQPLPTPLGWYAHQLPRPLLRAATSAVLACERYVPFLAFGPRNLRRAGFVLLALLQAGIAATGNYAFFNLISAALALWLLDDPALSPRLAERQPRLGARPHFARRVVTAALGVAIADTAVVQHRVRYGHRFPPARARRLARYVQPLASVNTYGLFSVMTTRRDEIVVEASMDGVNWAEYELPYKPGRVDERPRWVAPHQPRLDWQMWFAALGAPPAWFVRFLVRLLQASPDVLGLLESAPFSGPPRYVRASIDEYRMTTRRERASSGAWWKRGERRPYFPAIALSERLLRAP